MRHFLTVSIAVALAVFGFLSYWILVPAGILIALAFGNYLTALVLGTVADLLFGPPIGALHAVPLPFTLLACIGIALRIFLLPLLRVRTPTTL